MYIPLSKALDFIDVRASESPKITKCPNLNSLLRVLHCELFELSMEVNSSIFVFSYLSCLQNPSTLSLSCIQSQTFHGAKETVEELMPNPECPH